MRSIFQTAAVVLMLASSLFAQTPATRPTTQAGRGGRGPAPLVPANPALPTLWIASDSTAARGPLGWGSHMADYVDTSKINIANGAVSGQSSRTFQREGSWARIMNGVKKGDTVLIQFGHNDVTDVMTNDPIRQRGSIQTLGEETVQSPLGETVHSYGWYMRNMVKETLAKGATPIIVSLTTRNEWKDGKVERGFMGMNKLAIQLAKDDHLRYVDLTNIAGDAYDAMGQEKVKALFGSDTTHTAAEGADLNAKFIVSGLKALKDHPFDQYLTEKGKAVETDSKYAQK